MHLDLKSEPINEMEFSSYSYAQQDSSKVLRITVA